MSKKKIVDYDLLEDDIVNKIFDNYMNIEAPMDRLDVITMLRSAFRIGQKTGNFDKKSAYRLKHIPTGLFYAPVKHLIGNFTKNGKLYSRKPEIGSGIYCTIYNFATKKVSKQKQILLNYFKLGEGYINTRVFALAEEWEIIEI